MSLLFLFLSISCSFRFFLFLHLSLCRSLSPSPCFSVCLSLSLYLSPSLFFSLSGYLSKSLTPLSDVLLSLSVFTCIYITQTYIYIYICIFLYPSLSCCVEVVVSHSPSFPHTHTVSRPEWLFITVGILCSVAMGALMPIFSILFGDILGVIAYPDTQKARYPQTTICPGSSDPF